MWFVTLALLLVAAYFLYDALRDKQASASVTLDDEKGPKAAHTAPAAGDSNRRGAARIPAVADATPAASAGTAPSSARNRGQAASSKSVDSNLATVTSPPASPSNVNHPPSLRRGTLRFLDAPQGDKDDLTQIDGIGPIIEEELNSMGIFHLQQIANLTPTDITNINTELEFPGRIERDKWIPQARKLLSVQPTVMPKTGSSDTTPVIDTPTAALATTESAQSDLSDADYTGAWNTDVLIEIQERLKVLNTRESDAPRLQLSHEEYRALKEDEDGRFTREQLQNILHRLRQLD